MLAPCCSYRNADRMAVRCGGHLENKRSGERRYLVYDAMPQQRHFIHFYNRSAF